MQEMKIVIGRKHFFRKRFHEKSISFLIPESWEEMSQEQFLYLVDLSLKNLPEAEFRLVLLWRWSGINHKYFLQIPETAIPEILENIKINIDSGYSKTSKLSVYKEYIGVSDYLKDWSFERYAMAERYMYDFQNKKKDEDLHGLLTMLFSFEKFDFENSDKMLDVVSKFPQHVKIAAVINYGKLRNYLPLLYKYVFNGGEQEKIGNPGPSLYRMIINLSGSRFGTVDESGKKDLHAVMSYLDELEKNREDNK